MPEARTTSPAMLAALSAFALLSSMYGSSGSKPAQAGGGKTPAPKKRPRGRFGWWSVLMGAYNRFSDDRIMTEAAGVTFYVLLALFPAIATLISIYGLFADPAAVSEQLQNVAEVIPPGGRQIIEDQVKALASNGHQTLSFGVIVGVLTSLWSANQGIKSIFDALNVVHHEKEERGYIRRTILSLGFTFGAILFLVVAMLAIVVLPIVMNYVGFADETTLLLAVSRWPLLIVALLLFLSTVYRFGPCRTNARWHWITWGSAFSVIGWMIASLGFSYYVANFSSYNKTYGSLGAVIGFLTWIWITAMIVLFGAELNAEIEESGAS